MMFLIWLYFGVIPTENNISPLTGTSLDSEFSTNITGKIIVPSELEEYTTVYYSTNLSATTDLEDETNSWVTEDEVENWDKIVTFLIIIDDSYTLEAGETIEFSYEISIPNNVSLNEISYAGYAVYFSLNTDAGLYYTETSAEKLGFMITKQYDLEIIKYQEDTDTVLQGVTFILIDEDGNSLIETTDENGILTFSSLYAENYYTLYEYSTLDGYDLNDEKIVFYTYLVTDDEDNETINIVYIDDEENYQDLSKIYTWIKNIEISEITEEVNSDYKIIMEIENSLETDDVEVDLSFTKVNSSGTTTLSGATFNLYRKLCSDDHSSDLIGTGNYDEDCWELVGTYTSSSDGVVSIEGVNITYTYRLVETKAPLGYILPEGEWELTFNDETAESLVEVVEVIDGITLSVQGVNNPLAMSYIDSTIYIYNETYFDIPTTGSLGITDFFVIGINILGIGVIVVLINKLKKYNI